MKYGNRRRVRSKIRHLIPLDGCAMSLRGTKSTFYHKLAQMYLSKKCDTNRTHMSRNMTKLTKWHVRPAKTQISLGIRPVWSEYSLSAWRSKAWVVSYPLSAQRTKTVIRLVGYPCWFESLLGAQLFCWFCHEAAHIRGQTEKKINNDNNDKSQLSNVTRKHVIGGFRPGKAQTGLLSYRD